MANRCMAGWTHRAGTQSSKILEKILEGCFDIYMLSSGALAYAGDDGISESRVLTR